MKNILCILSFCFMYQVINAGCPETKVILTSQSDIDAFPANFPGCTDAPFGILIKESIPGDITNLDSLKYLKTIGISLKIERNIALTDISGLIQISSLDSLNIVSNNILPNLNGLDKLTNIGAYIEIYGNNGLLDISSLSKLKKVEGGFRLGANFNLQNIKGLKSLTSIKGTFALTSLNIQTLEGLESIIHIDGSLIIGSVKNLTNFKGLDSLKSIGGELSISGNNLLTSFSGLENLNFVKHIVISKHPVLIDISSLSELSSIAGVIYIKENKILQSLDGLDFINPKSISEIKLTDNPQLSYCSTKSICIYLSDPLRPATLSGNTPDCSSRESVTNDYNCITECPGHGFGLSSQTQIDAFPWMFPKCNYIPYGVIIKENKTGRIKNLDSLYQIKVCDEGFYVRNNSALKNLNGLSSLEKANLVIYDNSSLENLDGLLSYKECEFGLDIVDNPKLTSLKGLKHLINFEGDLYIENNISLTSLEGLENIKLNSFDYITIEDNTALSYCELTNICIFLEDNSNDAKIAGNALNCASIVRVKAACLVETDDNDNLSNQISITPNPSTGLINFDVLSQYYNGIFYVTNSLGQKVVDAKMTNNFIDLSDQQSGIYFLTIIANNKKVTKRIILF